MEIEDWTKEEGTSVPPIIKQEESIKLTKNAKGMFQWEVRILSLDVEKLKEINKKLEKEFGGKNE